jgi:hypothetical protein
MVWGDTLPDLYQQNPLCGLNPSQVRQGKTGGMDQLVTIGYRLGRQLLGTVLGMQSELLPQDFQTQVLTELRNINARLDRLEAEQRETKEQISRIRFEMEASQKVGERLERLATSMIAGATIAIIAGVVLTIIKSVA